ncbi:hypothetical protein TTHERM_000197689 (macronuclear) [Tetrahymena thermophila SB210]|uniref:Cyclic nucleotide-binding domain protein n=1 Tax=Tetrahymena thermophila (strain SB210) TaxID=312017 RepID=W7XHC5_TETTS|nr:hypothetical protein TTHERM_000197689 [Tetrahymena thermophila SB210]EWS76618.1 hypothetical protein TTHERM_000197689 [Tetrahymena thermophila SB210]|eukprot:XP_012650786.1 hypothetical protein TTHERM_000197689 [Tetrahymena thermophila SB210]
MHQKKYFNNVEEFLKSSLQFHYIVHIAMSHKQILDEGASSLGLALANCTNLTNLKLDLFGNKIGRKSTSALGSALSNCLNLQNLALYLSQNQIDETGASALISALANCTNLLNLTLNLSHNKIGVFGTSGLDISLENLINLTNLTLDFSDNKIGAKGASCLGSALKNLKNLSNFELYLISNKIGDTYIHTYILAHGYMHSGQGPYIQLLIHYYYTYTNLFIYNCGQYTRREGSPTPQWHFYQSSMI